MQKSVDKLNEMTQYAKDKLNNLEAEFDARKEAIWNKASEDLNTLKAEVDLFSKSNLV